MKEKILIISFVLVLLAVSIQAAVPPVINYQGKLMQPNGMPVPDGTYRVHFAIYDAPTNGNTLWGETNPSVQVKGSRFAVLLGSINNLGANILDSENRYLGIKIADEAEMNPRQRIASVATALRAGEADVAKTVSDGAITESKIADGAVTKEKIADASVSIEKLTGSSVGTMQIADAAVTSAKIADGSVTQTKAPSLLRATDLDGVSRTGLFLQTKRFVVPTTSATAGWTSPEQTWTFAVPFSSGCKPIVLATTTSEFYGYYVHPIILAASNTSVRFFTQRLTTQTDYRPDACNEVTLIAIGY